MRSRTLLVTASLVFAIGGIARAAELSTPTLVAVNNDLWCNIVNISAVAQTVRIRSYNEGGGLLTDTGDVVVAACATLWQHANGGRGHCRFTTVNAKSSFRAAIHVYDSGTGNVIASTPAQ